MLRQGPLVGSSRDGSNFKPVVLLDRVDQANLDNRCAIGAYCLTHHDQERIAQPNRTARKHP